MHTDAIRGARSAAAARSARNDGSSRADRVPSPPTTTSVSIRSRDRASAASDTSVATDTPLSDRTGCPFGVAIMVRYAGDAPSRVAVRSMFASSTDFSAGSVWPNLSSPSGDSS